jgi:hypothetical protein
MALEPPTTETPTDPDAVVEVRIHLRDTQTGDEAWYHFQTEASRAHDIDDPEGWYWTDGNGACDCERMRCLAAALGRPDPKIPCGDARVVIMDATVDGAPRKGWRDA